MKKALIALCAAAFVASSLSTVVWVPAASAQAGSDVKDTKPTTKTAPQDKESNHVGEHGNNIGKTKVIRPE